MKRFAGIAAAAGIIAIAAPVEAQLLYVGVRGGVGVPTGDFAQTSGGDQSFAGAKAGFGYGLDAGVNFGPFGLYAGFDDVRFGCEEATCGVDGTYRLQGLSGGVRLSLPLPVAKPWVKAGVTFNALKSEADEGSTFERITTKRQPGYEVGAGFDIPFGAIFSISPQARYVGQKLDLKEPLTVGTESNAASYYTFEIGLRIRTPL